MQEVYIDNDWLGDFTIFYWQKAISEGRETAALLFHVVQPLSICTEEMVNKVATVV